MKNVLSLILLSLSLPLTTLAKPLVVRVDKFNFQYNDPIGEGVADSFYRSELGGEKVQVQIEKRNNDFLFLVTGAENYEFHLKDAPSFMTKAKSMRIQNFNLNFEERSEIRIEKGEFRSEKDFTQMDQFLLNCNRNTNVENVVDQLIVGCLESMSIKAKSFNSSKVSNALNHILEDLGKDQNRVHDFSKLGSLDISHANISMKAGRLHVMADVKSDFNGRVRGKGDLSYDLKTKKITLKIDEVKFGILNITKKVFGELREIKNPNLEVNEPYVHFKIK